MPDTGLPVRVASQWNYVIRDSRDDGQTIGTFMGRHLDRQIRSIEIDGPSQSRTPGLRRQMGLNGSRHVADSHGVVPSTPTTRDGILGSPDEDDVSDMTTDISGADDTEDGRRRQI